MEALGDTTDAPLWILATLAGVLVFAASVSMTLVVKFKDRRRHPLT